MFTNCSQRSCKTHRWCRQTSTHDADTSRSPLVACEGADPVQDRDIIIPVCKKDWDRSTSWRCLLACLTLRVALPLDRLLVVTLSYPGQTLWLLVHGVFEFPVQLFGINYPSKWGIKTFHMNNLRANWKHFCSSRPTGRFCNPVNGRLLTNDYLLLLLLYYAHPAS